MSAPYGDIPVLGGDEEEAHDTNEDTTTTAANAAAKGDDAEQHWYSPCLSSLPSSSSDKALPTLDKSTTALIILNSPMVSPPSAIFETLWHSASFRVCADGGANRLYQATTTATASPGKQHADIVTTTDYLPDLITGDLDSLHTATRHYYEKRGVAIVKQYDQDYNDLDKAIRRIPRAYHTYLIYGAFGGRFDQEMAAIQALYVHGTTGRRMWLYNDENCAVLLSPGQKHVLQFPNFGAPSDSDCTTVQWVLGEGPTCGLIPVGEPCTAVTTQGLQWNLQQQSLAFGGLVSSSNRMVASAIHVECSHPLVFTAEMQIPQNDPVGQGVVLDSSLHHHQQLDTITDSTISGTTAEE